MKFTDEESINSIRNRYINKYIKEVKSSDISEENKAILLKELNELLSPLDKDDEEN